MALLLDKTYVPSFLCTHSLSFTDLALIEYLLCVLFPSRDTQMTKAGSARGWGGGSMGPANVGSPESFPAMLPIPTISIASCQMTSFLSFKALLSCSSKSYEMVERKRCHPTKREIGYFLVLSNVTS